MRYLFFIALLASSNAGAKELHLNSEKINIGRLPQASNRPVNTSFSLHRDSSTPKEIYLTFRLVYKEEVCSKYEQERVLIPGYQVCTGGDNNQCYWEPDRYEYRDYCVSYKTLDKIQTEKIKLRFRKAAKLKRMQEETFQIDLVQKDIAKNNLDISAIPLKTTKPYEIKNVSSIFRRKGFDFKVSR